MNISTTQARILISTIAAGAIPAETAKNILAELVKHLESNAIAIAKTFGCSTIIRNLTITTKNKLAANSLLNLEEKNNQIIYQSQIIGRTQILYKSPLPGELQAKLAIESAIDRFLEYLQKVHYIVALDESDRHVRVFIPVKEEPANFKELWKTFLKEVAFSDYGETKRKLPGLVQTFIVMLNAVTLSGRGFSTLDVPILTLKQANVLAAWYYAVIRDVRKRQEKRKQDIKTLKGQLENPELNDKDRKSKAKELQDKEAMQDKETKKYTEYFQKAFTKSLEEQNAAWQELSVIQEELANSGLAKTEQLKLQKQQDKLSSKLVFSQEFIQQKLKLIQEVEGNPFKFVQLDEKQNPDIFKNIAAIAKNFDKRATDQINSTRGDIFTQCVTEMYRLLELKPTQFDSLPEPLLTEKFVMPEMRSPGDDSKEFCYSCGVALDPKTARWQVLRFMFERPSQRRQSSSGEGRPHICSSCSALAFASPLKVTEESIIIRLDAANNDASELKIKDYIRMLTSKEIHLSAGRYLILASDRTIGGELASHKLGQIQYAIAKVASIFPLEVLTDFNFSLVIQGTQPLTLASRHLIFVKGLMDCYKQSTVISGKDINMTLGDAVRYMQQDLPFLADYTLTKSSNFSTDLHLEKVREMYWQKIQKDLVLKGDSMDSDNQLPKRAKLYRDVAALTGLTYAFVQAMESSARQEQLSQEDREREVGKLIEQVEKGPNEFCYYAARYARGDNLRARLYRNPDNHFIYDQAKELLEKIGFSDRQQLDEKQQIYLDFRIDDVVKSYTHLLESESGYSKRDLTYQLKLSLYSRFPEQVRKLKSTSEKN